MRAAERNGGGEIIDDLRDDAAPVDGIDAGQAHAVAEAVVVEHRLDDVLAVVERAFERDVVHVGVEHRGHLQALHRRGAALRMQDEDVGGVAAAEGLDGGRAGIARGGADNGRLEPALGEDVVHHPAEELHGDVLERQRRAMEQLEHEMLRLELDQRRHRGVAEHGVGLVDDLP